MHGKLIGHRDHLRAADLERYAEELGLDARRFWKELRQERPAARVAEDVASADASGVAGTPSFFINGKRQHGATTPRRSALPCAPRAIEPSRKNYGDAV
jgi:protein-disulfide isomerase